MENTNSKNQAVNSIPDAVISKTVDNILNNTKYTNNDFSTTTNLKITEKDRGYLEAYLKGQINKLGGSQNRNKRRHKVLKTEFWQNYNKISSKYKSDTA